MRSDEPTRRSIACAPATRCRQSPGDGTTVEQLKAWNKMRGTQAERRRPDRDPVGPGQRTPSRTESPSQLALGRAISASDQPTFRNQHAPPRDRSFCVAGCRVPRSSTESGANARGRGAALAIAPSASVLARLRERRRHRHRRHSRPRRGRRELRHSPLSTRRAARRQRAREPRPRARGDQELRLRVSVRRITINLAPADVRKAGSAFDLPIALGVLAANGVIAAATSTASCTSASSRSTARSIPHAASCPSPPRRDVTGRARCCSPRQTLPKPRSSAVCVCCRCRRSPKRSIG